MSNPPLAFETVAAFPTPILVIDLPDGAQLNAALLPTLLKRETEQPSKSHSTLGGWQSTWDVDKWAGVPAIKLLAVARNVANRATVDRAGQPVSIMWQANMWANINRSGHGNEFHSHPGSYWSGVYYVDDGGIQADPSLGGELEFMDPRGPAPAMYAPHLAFALPGGLSVGTNQTIVPKAGRLVMFPSWVLHQVRPYRGTAQRISIALNLSL
ncbi:TIGR02466 family protein [uncultured Reyranella sp.]|jgi:uncharacterized protein (TIGR02466 family)|uniref:TIGR02466 family protein n=1 Tax=uncultured Reyranella sp. TaxID=735512 RepID=UPI00259CAE0A|nr:TIGR02466 family protein [uncultured Reyranella sp.]